MQNKANQTVVPLITGAWHRDSPSWAGVWKVFCLVKLLYPWLRGHDIATVLPGQGFGRSFVWLGSRHLVLQLLGILTSFLEILGKKLVAWRECINISIRLTWDKLHCILIICYGLMMSISNVKWRTNLDFLGQEFSLGRWSIINYR